VLTPAATYVYAYGYNDDAANAHSVWDHDYGADASPPQGTFITANETCAGDQAACVEWKTDRKNSRGKWIYLRKYFHTPTVVVGNPDVIESSHQAAYNAFASLLSPAGGAFYGGLRSRTHSDNITGQGVLQYVTTRTLKRRGKRPLPRP
jgi:hypothetical protein